MTEQKKRLRVRLAPKGLAESANRRFVGLAGLIFRAVNWRRPVQSSTGGETPDPGQPARGDGVEPSEKPIPIMGVLALEPEALGALAKKVDEIAKRTVRAHFSNSSEFAGAPKGAADELLERKLRELFHQDAWHRLAAIRWIREHRCTEAISTLEGVLSIEESDEVRIEIGRALTALGARTSNSKGDQRCSRSSEVSL